MLSRIWAELQFPDSCWDLVAQVNHCADVCPGGNGWDISKRTKACTRRVEVRDFALKPVGYPTSACDGGLLPYSCLTYGYELDQLISDRSQRTVPIELRPDSGQ